MKEFFGLLTKAGEKHPSAMDNEWKQEVRATLALLAAATEKIVSLKPVPADLAQLADVLENLDRENKALGKDFLKAFEGEDAAVQQSVLEHLAAVNGLLDQVGTLAKGDAPGATAVPTRTSEGPLSENSVDLTQGEISKRFSPRTGVTLRRAEQRCLTSRHLDLV